MVLGSRRSGGMFHDEGRILQQEEGGLAKVVWGLGGEVLAPHIDVERVTRFFEEQHNIDHFAFLEQIASCLLYTSPSPRDRQKSRMPSSA